MRIALESAAEMKLDLPGLTLAKKLYDKLAADGMETAAPRLSSSGTPIRNKRPF